MPSADEIRAAAIEWVRRGTMDGTVPISRDRLATDFLVEDERFPLVDRGRGIRTPRGWTSALSILTAVAKSGRDRPYADDVGPDGLHRYKLRRDQRGSAENESLRAAMRARLPLIWFVGIAPGVFTAIAPIWLMAEEREQNQFVVALSPFQRTLDLGSEVEKELREYILAETKRRLHQPLFANKIMLAYDTRCAVCRIGHRELLDAAHIIPDNLPLGQPIVTNGLALCKIHHAAYDRNILGIRPDYVVQIHHRLLDEIDGPMLRHGLQDHHGRPLLQVPQRRLDRPDPLRLEERFAQFRAA